MDSDLSIGRSDEKQERGVALPTVLLIAFLLMVATIAMLSAAGANSRNVTDALDETKAYYAAESGISAAIHVMRDQKVDYSTAFSWVGREYAGSLDDTRNWLDYNQNCTPHRVTIGFGLNDCSNAYKITVSDPANSRNRINFSTYDLSNTADMQVGFRVSTPTPTPTPAGQTPDPNATPIPYYPVLCFKGNKLLDPDCSDPNRTQITWTPKDPNPGGTTASFGSCASLQTGVLIPCVHSTLGWFEMHRNGTGGIVPRFLQFRINFNLVEDEGFVWGITGKIDCIDDVPDPDPNHRPFDKGCNDDNITTDPDAYGKITGIKTTLTKIDGSEIMLCKTESICNKPSAPPLPGQKYIRPPLPVIDEKRLFNNVANAPCTGPNTDPYRKNPCLAIQLTPAEPRRMVIRSEGFGPNGSSKKLEAILDKGLFPPIPPIAGILLLGPYQVKFNRKTSNNITLNGCEPVPSPTPGDTPEPPLCVPAIGVTNAANLTYLEGLFATATPAPDPPPELIPNDELPEWLQTAGKLDNLVYRLKSAALNARRCFGPKPCLAMPGAGIVNPGNNDTGTGLTFCAADCTVKGSGGGILVGLGRIKIEGPFSFKGLILATGKNGKIELTKNNAATLSGSIVVAPYDFALASPYFKVAEFKVGDDNTDNTSLTFSLFNALEDSGGVFGLNNIVYGVAEK